MRLVHEETGKEIEIGQKVMSFRNEEFTVLSIEKPHKPSSTGRIYTEAGGRFPSVYGCKWIEREDQ